MLTIGGDPSLLGKPGGNNWPTHVRCEACGHVAEASQRTLMWTFFAMGARVQRYWRDELKSISDKLSG